MSNKISLPEGHERPDLSSEPRRSISIFCFSEPFFLSADTLDQIRPARRRHHASVGRTVGKGLAHAQEGEGQQPQMLAHRKELKANDKQTRQLSCKTNHTTERPKNLGQRLMKEPVTRWANATAYSGPSALAPARNTLGTRTRGVYAT